MATSSDRPGHALFVGYSLAVVACVVATLAQFFLEPLFGNRFPLAVFSAAVAAAAWSGGSGPGLLATLIAGLVGNYFFLNPRYTLTVRDNLVDPVGNRLDGESGASQPSDNPFFPSGDGVPGGNFVARFTIDTRPEIGVWAAGTVLIDTNGNFLFDPESIDFTNRDLTYTLGFASDYVFAGNFVLGAGATADGFDKLAAYGRVGNQWRFLIDVTNDGVPFDGLAEMWFDSTEDMQKAFTSEAAQEAARDVSNFLSSQQVILVEEVEMTL